MKDAQGQSYWQMCRAEDFQPETADVAWDPARHCLALAGGQAARIPGVPPADTRAAALLPAVALDAYGGWARVERRSGTDRVMAGGATDPEIEIFAAPGNARIADITVTSAHWLVIVLRNGQVIVRDLLERFLPVTLEAAGFEPTRCTETADGSLWLLDRAGKVLRRLSGDPLPKRVRRARAPDAFRPEPDDPDPLRIAPPAPVDLSAMQEEIIDMAALPDGRLALLGLRTQRRSALRLTDGLKLSTRIDLPAVKSAFSIGAYGGTRVALLVPGADRAILVDLLEDGTARPLDTLLPLRNGTGERLCRGLPGDRLHYPTTPQSRGGGELRKPFARLVPPSRPSYARNARVRTALIDGGQPGFTWHRAFLDAGMPAGCGLVCRIAAGDDPVALDALPANEMHAHWVGAAGQGASGPRAVWLDMESERPWLRSPVGGPRKRDRCGLFSVLLQKTGGDVKRIRGRFLRVEITLTGPGTATPRLHALRVWGERRSWRDRFLPDHLSQEEGPLAAGSDFLDRSLALFESVLTPMEDEVGASYRLTRPDATPADALDWLAGWIGAELDSGLSEAARRRMLAQSVQLWRRRGTRSGLERVLDIVTEGGVARGDLVVLEHFHLRRTFSTLLGVDLSDATNPLVPWSAHSGNSHLGATFFLGDDDRRFLIALFAPDIADVPLMTVADRLAAAEQVQAFLDDHAFRVTVLVQAGMARERTDLIRRALEREVPAHVIARIAEGPGSLVLALSSLLGVDSRFGATPPRDPLTVGSSEIGQAWLTDTPSLDPRFEGGA